MEVKYGLACSRPDVDDNAVVLEALRGCCLGHEPQHPARLLIRKRIDFAERVDVTLGQHEEMDVCRRRNIADRDEAVDRVHVVAPGDQVTEETVSP